jgi:hypothetical protein
MRKKSNKGGREVSSVFITLSLSLSLIKQLLKRRFLSLSLLRRFRHFESRRDHSLYLLHLHLPLCFLLMAYLVSSLSTLSPLSLSLSLSLPPDSVPFPAFQMVFFPDSLLPPSHPLHPPPPVADRQCAACGGQRGQGQGLSKVPAQGAALPFAQR